MQERPTGTSCWFLMDKDRQTKMALRRAWSLTFSELYFPCNGASQVALVVKNPSAMQETQETRAQFLG